MTGERALIARAVAGEQSALDELASRHRPVVFRTARHVLGDGEAADDVAQDVFLRLQTSLPGFRGDAELSTWLYRITLNLCRDRLRRDRKAQTHVPLSAAADLSGLRPEGGPDAAIDGQRLRRAVRDAIERLPEDQKEAVMLRYLSDLTYAEIAERTHTPQGTVASRVFRALRRLGEDLESRHLELIQ